MGVAETIADIVGKMDPSMAAACLRNIVCCGGSSSIPNFSQRLLQVPMQPPPPPPRVLTLAQDVRSMVPQVLLSAWF